MILWRSILSCPSRLQVSLVSEIDAVDQVDNLVTRYCDSTPRSSLLTASLHWRSPSECRPAGRPSLQARFQSEQRENEFSDPALQMAYGEALQTVSPAQSAREISAPCRQQPSTFVVIKAPPKLSSYGVQICIPGLSASQSRPLLMLVNFSTVVPVLSAIFQHVSPFTMRYK